MTRKQCQHAARQAAGRKIRASASNPPPTGRHCPLSSQYLEKPGALAHMCIMHIPHLHDWTVTPREAIALQKQLAGQLVLDRPLDLSAIRHVAGVDVSVREGLSRAAVVVLSFPDLQVVETVLADAPTPFPYVPGLLTFREGPVLEEAFARLETEPDAFIFDGAGCAHPRGIGVASHMGLWLGRPSVGCAKTRLTGWSAGPGPSQGDVAALLARPPTSAEPAPPCIGAVLRTRANVAPVYVSPGHLIDQASAVALVSACLSRFRLPEPVRAAHRAAALTAASQPAFPGL